MMPVVRGERETRRQILLYTRAALRRDPAAVLRGRLRGRPTSSPRWSWGPCSSPAPSALYRRADRRSALRLYLFSLAVPGAAVRRDGPRRQALGGPPHGPQPRPQEHPHRPDRRRRCPCSCSACRSWPPPSTSRADGRRGASRSRRPARRRGDPPPRPDDPAAAHRRRHHARAGRRHDLLDRSPSPAACSPSPACGAGSATRAATSRSYRSSTSDASGVSVSGRRLLGHDAGGLEMRRRRSSSGRCRGPRGRRRPRRCSMTMRWRKPPWAIAAAASSSDQSGVAKTRSEVRCAATQLRVRVLARTDRPRMSRSVMIPGPGASGSWTTAAPTLRSRHQAWRSREACGRGPR